MAFTSFSFLGLVTGTVLLSNVFTSASARAWILLFASAIYLLSHVDHALQLLPLLLFLAASYAAIEVARRRRSTALSGSLALGMILSFLILKRYSFVPPALQLDYPYLVVGLSYVLFRVLHLLIDAQQGGLPARVGVRDFALYSANFLTFTAGPIQRHADFAAGASAPHRLQRADAEAALTRIVRGFVKVGVASAALNHVFELLSVTLLSAGASVGWPKTVALHVLCAALYTGHLYANFSGYVDIVLGVGRLIGRPLPENFDRPFAARSFLELWSRWHMTLSSWFKTYVFNPLLKLLTTHVSSVRFAPYLAAVAFFATFLVMGMWHGASFVFIVYGLALGAGASLNKAWQVVATKRFGKQRYKAWAERPLAIYAARGLTFGYFALALTCFWVDLPQLLALTRALGAAGWLAGYALLSSAAAAGFYAFDTLIAWWGRATSWLDRARELPALRDLARGALVLLVLAVGSFFHQAPAFVYRAF
jgi:alginate O-acetyltransferase complex protein AlgI